MDDEVDDLRETTKRAFLDVHRSIQAKNFAQIQAMQLIMESLSDFSQQDVTAQIADKLEALGHSAALGAEDDDDLQREIAAEVLALVDYFRD